MNKYVLIACLLSIVLVGNSQTVTNIPHPTFTEFRGDVYDMPEFETITGKLRTVKIQEYYSDKVYSYPKLGEIVLDKINIPESSIKGGSFPGVEKKTAFAMILESQMEISLDACYEFSLNSDDGSRLWIDGQPIVDNDGGHQLKLKKDSVVLQKGSYPIKLWYFQGLPTKFGFQFDARIVGKPAICPNYSPTSTRKFVLNDLYFNVDKSEISPTGIEDIAEVVKNIIDSKTEKIKVIGHTDNTGSEDYNIRLSTQRAKSVEREILNQLNDRGLKIVVTGKGSSEPVADNQTEEGRRLNRRVEVIFL